MATSTKQEILFEALGSPPHFRQDWLLPLITGRVQIEGVNLTTTGPHTMPAVFEDPKSRTVNSDYWTPTSAT